MVEKPLQHGGDVEGFFLEHGFEPIDFSANVSPLGTPEAVKEAIRGCLQSLDAYPDPLNRRLVDAISQFEGLPQSMIACGNGSSDLLYRIPLALRPRRATLCAPSFAEYADSLMTAGCQLDYVVLTPGKGFRLDQDFVDAIGEETDLVYVCQPNNPTGTVTQRPLMERILARCEEVGAHLLVDECFIDFLDDPAAVTIAPLVPEHPCLMVLKAYTKIYALAGVRLGYLLCSDAALLEAVGQAGQPWSVSTMAQEAGIAALGCRDYVLQVRRLVKAERAFLTGELARLGLDAQGEANFLFFHVAPELPLVGFLRERAILIRDCSNYEGLEKGYYRIAVKGHEDNVALVEALEDFFGKER